MHKHNIILIFIFVLSFIFIGSSLFIDYNNYKIGSRSLLFGTKDTYSQEQTLHFDNLDLFVTEVERRDYKPVDPIDCERLPEKPRDYRPDTDLPGFTEPQKWRDDCFSVYDNGNNYEEHVRSKDKINLLVHFFYGNRSDKVIDLNEYGIEAVANTDITYKDKKIIKGDMLAQSEEYGVFSLDIDKDYKGPFNLVVTKDGKKKNIELIIPQKVQYWP